MDTETTDPQPGKTGRKRTDAQIIADRAEISRLYLQRVPLQEITDRVNAARITSTPAYQITIHQVKKDLVAIREDWITWAAVDYDTLVARELARIDNLETEAFEAWRRSCGDFEESTERHIGGVDTRTETQTRRRKQAGDPRFLERIAWCIDARIKILGLAAPDVHLLAAGKGMTFTLQLGEKEIGDESDGQRGGPSGD